MTPESASNPSILAVPPLSPESALNCKTLVIPLHFAYLVLLRVATEPNPTVLRWSRGTLNLEDESLT